MKKALASTARQQENEFIAKCYITTAPPNSEGDSKSWKSPESVKTM